MFCTTEDEKTWRWSICVPLQLQVLDSEHLDNKSNQTLANGNVAGNRNLSTEKIKSTEAGLYFDENAIEIGLADNVIAYSEFINRRNIMNKTEIKEQAIDIKEERRCDS